MAPRGGYDRSAYTGVGEAPPHSHYANPLALAAAGAVGGGDGSSRCSSLSSAAAATALRRHSLTQESLHSLQDHQRTFSPLPAAGSGMRRSNSTASNTSRTTTIKRTNPDRSMSLTRRTVSQYGSFEIVKEDTKFIPPPPKKQQSSPRLMLSPSYPRGPPSILSDSDLATVSEEEPLHATSSSGLKFGESEIRHNPPPRTLSPIKPALKDSSSIASSDNESISGAKYKKPHARVSFFEDDEPSPNHQDAFRHFGAASLPSHNYNINNNNRKTSPSQVPPSTSFNTMNAKTHAAQAAFKPKTTATTSAPRSPNLAAAAAARSHKSINRNPKTSPSDDDREDDSGDSIYSDCNDGLETNDNNNNNSSIMETLHQAPQSKKKGLQQQQPTTLRTKKPQDAKPSSTTDNAVVRKPIATATLRDGKEQKKLKPVALDITPRPSDADDDDSDDSDTWRRQRMARRRNGNGSSRMRMSLREENKQPRSNNNPTIPTPPPSDTSATAQPHIPASVMATAAQNVALTTKAMNGGVGGPVALARTPSESSFKKERAANGGDSGLQNGFRLSLRNEADNSNNGTNQASGTGGFKSRFDDSDSEDDFAAPPLAPKADYLSAPPLREKDSVHKEHNHKKLSVFSPKKEAKVLIPRKKPPSKSQLNGGADLAPISSASAADSPTEPAAPKATKSVPTMRPPKPAATADNYYPAAPIHHKRFKGLRRLFKLD